MEAPKSTRLEQWTKRDEFVHRSAAFDGQATNYYVVEFADNGQSPLNVDLGVAPEKAQPFGQRSKQHLSDLVFGKNVALDCTGTDRYHRAICVVLVDGQDANLAQIEAGMAWWYHKYSSTQTPARRVAYQAAETTAQSARRGLWTELSPTPPWEWRHR